MAKQKQYVFSARTTEEGLKALNELKGRLKVNWDELAIEAVSAHYELDKAMMTLPRKEKPAKEAQPAEPQSTSETGTEPSVVPEQEHATKAKRPAKKPKKSAKKASD